MEWYMRIRIRSTRDVIISALFLCLISAATRADERSDETTNGQRVVMQLWGQGFAVAAMGADYWGKSTRLYLAAIRHPEAPGSLFLQFNNSVAKPWTDLDDLLYREWRVIVDRAWQESRFEFLPTGLKVPENWDDDDVCGLFAIADPSSRIMGLQQLLTTEREDIYDWAMGCLIAEDPVNAATWIYMAHRALADERQADVWTALSKLDQCEFYDVLDPSPAWQDRDFVRGFQVENSRRKELGLEEVGLHFVVTNDWQYHLIPIGLRSHISMAVPEFLVDQLAGAANQHTALRSIYAIVDMARLSGHSRNQNGLRNYWGLDRARVDRMLLHTFRRGDWDAKTRDYLMRVTSNSLRSARTLPVNWKQWSDILAAEGDEAYGAAIIADSELIRDGLKALPRRPTQE